MHDLASYEKTIRTAVQDVDQTTLLYLKEAMQAYRSGCILSTAVMLGVAAEHAFNLLIETVDATGRYEKLVDGVRKQRGLLKQVEKFRASLDAFELPNDIKEDLNVRFLGVLSVIRESRNESGHPTGKVLDRDAAYGLLCIFPHYCQKMYQLRQWFQTPAT